MVLLWKQRVWATGLLMMCALAAGCGDGPQMADVTGQVTYQGQPVPGGKVMLSPLREGDSTETKSRSAVGLVGTDGKFTMLTYSDGDGASIGRHGVIYYPPDREDLAEDSAAAEAKEFFSTHLLQMEEPLMEVEIKPGNNEIEVKMIDFAPAK